MRQLSIIIAAAALITLCLFPPHTVRYANSAKQLHNPHLEHRPIWQEPGLTYQEGQTSHAEINKGRFALYAIFITAVGAVGYSIAKKP